ncbi:MAG: SPASM domain-containing protein [Deltaproteobacteria bacterium]|nr:SPASM domain-containing protein [Deltaproteobacteria bacterium]
MKKFKKIYLEITNRCNLSCSFCPRSERAKAFMRLEDFRAILGKIKDHTDHLALHVLGEPLLHPELDELLALCQEHGLKVNLTTNGTLLPQRQGLLLASPALRQVNISLHGLAELPDAPALEAALAGVLAFVQEAMRTPIFISLRLWNLSAAEGNGHNQHILNRITDFFALPEPLTGRLAPGHGLTLAPKVFLSQNARFTWPHAPAPDLGDKGTCRGLRDHVAILADGTVVPCCLDAEADIPLGNIHHQSLADICASPRATTIRTGFTQRRLSEPLCRRCTFRQSF